ncbi:MAG TPA: hypothetical protein VGJ39_00515, partial [Vicinamibacterales bacterium]
MRLTRALLVMLFAVTSAILVPSAQEVFVTPNENLVTDGIPGIPAVIAEKAARYTEFRAAAFQGWHPTRHEMLILTRFADTDQVHAVGQPMGARKQLTFLADRVLSAEYEPTKGDYFLFRKDVGGDEWFQIYRYDLATGDITRLTDGRSRNDDEVFNHQGSRIVYSSTRRNGKDSDIWTMDPANPKTDRLLAQVESGGWFPTDWSHSGKWFALIEYISANESYLWQVDAETGSKRAIVERGGEPALYENAQFSQDDGGLFATTDHGSEFHRLTYIDLATRKQTPLTSSIPWDVDEFQISRDGKHVAFVTNEDGASKLYILDTATRQFHPISGLPNAV